MTTGWGHDDQWRTHAACGRGVRLYILGADVSFPLDPDMWFPTRGKGDLARRICAGCPVRVDCLVYSIEKPETDGIWGGAGELVRRHFRKLHVRSAGIIELHLLGAVGTFTVPNERVKRTYLIEIQDHFDRLDEFAVTGINPAGVLKVLGPNVTHGKRSTYARGCRGDDCMIARGLKPRGVPCPTRQNEQAG